MKQHAVSRRRHLRRERNRHRRRVLAIAEMVRALFATAHVVASDCRLEAA